MIMLGAVFATAQSEHRVWKTFYKVVPMLLLCYFLPSLLTAFGIVDPRQSRLYFVASQYLLPASLVLLTISIDLREVLKLGPKALIMFVTGSVGVILGGPLSIWLVGQFDPELVGGEGPDAVWRGMATVAGSWIGGGANQAAMKEIFGPSDRLYSLMVAVDVIIAEIWMLFLLLGVGEGPGHRSLDGSRCVQYCRIAAKNGTLPAQHGADPHHGRPDGNPGRVLRHDRRLPCRCRPHRSLGA